MPTPVRFTLPLELRVPDRTLPPVSRVGQFLLAFVLGLSPSISAQTSDAPVPRDLAVAFARSLASADSQSAVDFLAAQIPPVIQSLVHLPPSARVLGTVIVGRTSFVMAATPLPPDSILHAIAHDYGAAHWEGLNAVRVTSVGNPASGGPPIGGFRPAHSAFPSTFCHDSVEVIATATHADAQTTNVRLRVDRGANPCARMAAFIRTGGAPPPPRFALPMLNDPAGASFAPQCTFPARSSSTQTQLATSMDLPALIEHYGKQLEAQGWSPTSIDAPLIRKVWSRRDSAGATATATLSVGVSPMAPMCRDASLIVSTPIAR